VSLALVALIANAGCRSGGIPLLNLFGVGKPLVVALVAEPRTESASSPLELLNPFAPYEPLRKALGEHMGRPVAMDLCLPIQVNANLAHGFYHLAIVSPVQFAEFNEAQGFAAIAVPIDEQQRPARCAVLVTGAKSDIRKVEDLRGRKVAFGPERDARTHQAGLALLKQHGLAKTDLSLEVLPIPGSLRHFPDMRSIAQSVQNGSYAAGFIDEAAWEALAERGEREGEPSRDKLRVIGRTVAVPDRLIVCSPTLDAATTEKVRSFLLAVGKEHAEVLRPLRVSGYLEPGKELLETCRELGADRKASEGPVGE